MVRLSAALVAMLVLTGCGAIPTAPDFVAPTVAQLQSVPEFAAVAGVPARLKPDVYRDVSLVLFAGQTPPPENGVFAFLRVSSTEGSPLPANLAASRVWVVHGQDIWTVVTIGDVRNSSATEHDWSVGYGPPWKINDVVDVVIELKINGSTVRLRAANQQIGSIG